MANLLDETQGPVNDNGRDVHVIDRQLPVTITFRSTLFEIALWVTLPLLTLIYVLAMGDQLADPTTVAIGGCVAGVQQNNYLQREITAARTVYNSRVTQWNTDLFSWPTKMIVAARQGYTTRIPFTASAETREMARSKFF